nr:hypothetical protein [Tanacetum cinerariifolium]
TMVPGVCWEVMEGRGGVVRNGGVGQKTWKWGADMTKIIKKRPKPDKNEHEIVKSIQNPDPKTFLFPKAQQKPIKSKSDCSCHLSKFQRYKFLCKMEDITPGTDLAISKG